MIASGKQAKEVQGTDQKAIIFHHKYFTSTRFEK